MAIRSWTLDGKTFGLTRDDVGADGYPLLPAGEYFKTWPVMVTSLVADMAKVVGWRDSASASATAAAGSATAAAASATGAAADRATGQQLVSQAQSARDASAASAVLAQSSVGTATNVIVPAINYRLASAWDANSNATAYNLTNVVATGVYDTAKDPDGGRWCKGRLARMTTWYNEPLNTATRGAKRRFPAVAEWVLTTTQLIIYDQNDLDANGSPRMWKVFANGSVSWATVNILCGTNSCAAAKGGRIVVGDSSGTFGEVEIDFPRDRAFRRTSTAGFGGDYRGTLADANSGKGYAQNLLASQVVASTTVNSIDLRILPGTQLDPVSRLPIPTIAVATAGGVSVIHPTGLVANITGYGAANGVRFLSDGRLMQMRGNSSTNVEVGPIPFANISAWIWVTAQYSSVASSGLRPLPPSGAIFTTATNGAIGSGSGITFLAEDPANPANGMVSYVTKDYATGWMPGDTRLCAITEGAGSNGASGGELIANGDFSAGTANWSSLPGGEVATLSVVSGALRVTPTGAWGGASQTISTVVGQQYTVFFDIVAVTGIQATIRVRDTGGDVLSVPPDGPGTGRRSCTFVARQTATVILLFANGGSADFDNVSCRKTGTFSDAVTGSGELIVNGGFDTDTVWTKGTGWAIGGGVATKTAGAVSTLRNSLSPVVGQYHKLLITVAGMSAGTLQVYAGGGQAGPNITANGSYQIDFYASTTGAGVLDILADASFNGSVDNVSVKLCVPDRSYKGKGLIVNGTLTRAPVAAGSDLYWLSGFGSNAYLEQPYNADFDPGTGDWWRRRWVNKPTGFLGVEERAAYSVGYSGARISVAYLNTNDKVQVGLVDASGNSQTITSIATVPSSSPTCVDLLRRGGNLEIWLNGVLDTVVALTASGSYTNTSALERVGVRFDGVASSSSFALTLVRFGTYAPTPSQIRRMYADEAALFQPGAKAFLGGTSNNVQSLALDEDTGVIHVATDGVDKFAGLRNVGRIAANTQGIGSELVGNGTFDTDINGWTQVSGTVAWSNGTLRGTASGGAPGRGARSIACTAGKSYVLTGDVKAVSSGYAAAFISTSTATGAAVAYVDSLIQGSRIAIPFTATASTMYVLLQPASTTTGVYAEFDNISVREIGAVSANSVTSVSAGGGAVLVGTVNEAGVVSDLTPIKDELRQPAQAAANSNDIVFDGVTTDNVQAALGRIFVNEGESVLVDALVEATEYGLTPVEGASFRITARLRRNYGGNVAIVGNVLVNVVDRTTSTLDATLTVDTTNNSFGPAVKGKASTRMLWRTSMRLVWLSENRTAA